MVRLFPRATRTRKLLKYTLITTPVVGGIGYTLYSFDTGFRRQFDFYVRAFPVLCHYKSVEYMHEYLYKPRWIPFFHTDKTLNDKLDVLHEKYAQYILDVILELKGLYVKAGQFATSRPDIVPPCWIDKLRTLQDGVPAQDMSYVRSVVEAELGDSIESIFSEFRPESLGAASIGQAHYAKLKADARHGIDEDMEVCVKLQYPEMEAVFGADLRSIRRFVSFMEPAIASALEEMETQFLKEFDYIREADNLRVAFKNMNQAFANEVVVPQPIEHLCTRNVLTMTYIPGEKLEIAIKKKLKQLFQLVKRNHDPLYNPDNDKDREISLSDLRAELMANNGGQSFAPKVSMRSYRWTLSLRRYAFNTLAAIFNNGVAWMFYPLCTEHDKLPYIPYDVPIVNDPLHFVETLLNVHGYQIFVNGSFNGDPHPGNIMLMPDGRLGLIDYGQFKYLTAEERYEISRLYIALSSGDPEQIAQQAKNMGVKTRKMDTEYISKFTVFGYDRLDLEFREGKSTMQFIQDLNERDTVEKIPGNYYLVMRTVFLLRGLAALMQVDVSVAKYWTPYARQFLQTYEKKTDST